MSVNFFCVGDGLLGGRVGDGRGSASLTIPYVFENISETCLAIRVDERCDVIMSFFPSLLICVFAYVSSVSITSLSMASVVVSVSIWYLILVEVSPSMYRCIFAPM